MEQLSVDKFRRVIAPEPLRVKGRPPAALDDMIATVGEVPRFKTPHRIQQHEALAFAIHNRRSLLFYEMRTGKTKISLDWLTFLFHNQFIEKALIIAHAPVAIGTWQAEVATHSFLNVVPVVSGKKAAQTFMDAVDDPDVHAILITWSTLQALFSVRKLIKGENKGRFHVDARLVQAAAACFEAVVIDEIHMSKDPSTLRFDIANELVNNCHWRLGLTGTPVGRDPYALWAQFYLIDEGARLGPRYPLFQRAFGKQKKTPFTYAGFEWVFDDRYMPLLREKIKDIVLECELREIHEVNVIKSVIPLHMTGDQLIAYRDVLEEIKRLKQGEAAKIENAFIRCRQIASGWRPFVDENGNQRIRDFDKTAKFVWLEDLLENLGPEIQLVIFHEYIHTGYRLDLLLKKHKVPHGWLYGGTKDRVGTIARFQAGASQILIANAATGGTGTNLSAADYLCFFESPPGVITRRQAEFRPLARGARPLVIDDLVCAPIEQRILEFHAQGKDVADLLRMSPREIAEALRV